MRASTRTEAAWKGSLNSCAKVMAKAPLTACRCIEPGRGSKMASLSCICARPPRLTGRAPWPPPAFSRRRRQRLAHPGSFLHHSSSVEPETEPDAQHPRILSAAIVFSRDRKHLLELEGRARQIKRASHARVAAEFL